jgi:hypothetical protein
MTVVGNRAVIGGFVTADNVNPQFVGLPALFYVIVNGGPGGGAALDRTGPRLVYLLDEEGLPAGFPDDCGPPTIPSPFGYTNVTAGDVAIHTGL